MADWTTNSNEALTLSLVRSKADQYPLGEGESYENFHPTFTYPIYGDDEKIYGYKDLLIDLRFTSGSLTYYLDVQYSEKLPSSSTIDDVEGMLAKFIPSGYYTDRSEFEQRVEEDAAAFKPCGELIYSYTRPAPIKGKGKGVATCALATEDDIVYEVYHTTWDTPGFRAYHRRMQLFILLYVEAGSYIVEDEDSWEFVVLYEKRKRSGCDISTYHFIGYSSLYGFYHFPEKTRLRLSQFIIVSPYQKKGHGSQLYKAIYQYVLSKPHIAELTVEDPAEAFEDLRDKNDIQMLQNHDQFIREAYGSPQSVGGRVGGVGRARKTGHGGVTPSKGRLNPPADKTWIEKWRKDLKIAGRQFQRLIEMLILLRLDPHDARALKAYRLQVKERLYRFNFEVLIQLDKQERFEKLEETFQNVCDDYARILGLLK